jgi:hypothetical protein
MERLKKEKRLDTSEARDSKEVSSKVKGSLAKSKIQTQSKTPTKKSNISPAKAA